MKRSNIITRSLQSEQISLRSADDGRRYLEGYAIVFNQRSKLIREWGETFFEVIEPTAPDRVLSDPGLNTIATIDHDRAKMLGRVKSGTLQLTKDARGLKYTIELPDTTLGRDIAAMVGRGDYFESSFIFTIADKGYRYDRSEDIAVRYVSDFENLFDVAIVVDGAYANTAVRLRSQEWEEEEEEEERAEEEEEEEEEGDDETNTDEEEEEPARSIDPGTDILLREVEILKLKIK